MKQNEVWKVLSCEQKKDTLLYCIFNIWNRWRKIVQPGPVAWPTWRVCGICLKEEAAGSVGKQSNELSGDALAPHLVPHPDLPPPPPAKPCQWPLCRALLLVYGLLAFAAMAALHRLASIGTADSGKHNEKTVVYQWTVTWTITACIKGKQL